MHVPDRIKKPIKHGALKRKRKRRRNPRRRRPINVLASALTTVNLYCGIASIFAAIEGKYEQAAYLILAAIILDMLDGTVARMTKSVSDFGKELDSLCDVVSFGVAPAVLIYTTFLPVEESIVTRTGALMAIVYVICVALRLARFNVFQAEIREYFVGLPSPAAAGTMASFVLFTQYFTQRFEMTVSFWVFGPLTIALAYLMVSTVRYPKNRIKSMLLTPRYGFRFLVLVAVGIAVFDQARRYHPSIVLFPLAASYVVFGVADTFYYKFQWRGSASDQSEPSSVAGSSPESSVKKDEAR